MIECTTFYRQKTLVPQNKLTFRPSVYAIITIKEKILLLNTRHTNTYSLPGGGIEIGEPIEAALKRETKEETGIEIEIVRFFRFKEDFFYYDPTDVAFHSFLFFYICEPKTLEVCRDDQVDDDAVEKPRWIAIKSLDETHFHSHGKLILDALHSLTV